MRSVDFELLSAIGGMCFLSSCCWRALSVLSSRHLRWKSHQPSQKPGVCRCCCGTYIQPQPQKTYGRQHWRTVRWCSRCSLLHIVSAHCTTLRCKNPHVPAPHMLVCIWLGRKMDQVAQKPGKGQLSPAGSSVLLPLLASWYVPSAFVMLTSCSSQNIGNTFPVSSDPPVSVARCKILSFSRNFER